MTGEILLIEECRQLTEEIVGLLSNPENPLDSLPEKMKKREDQINELKVLVDKAGAEAVSLYRPHLSRLLQEDEKMRTTLANLLNQTSEALRQVDHEEKAGRSYSVSTERDAFITGRLEG